MSHAPARKVIATLLLDDDSRLGERLDDQLIIGILVLICF